MLAKSGAALDVPNTLSNGDTSIHAAARRGDAKILEVTPPTPSAGLFVFCYLLLLVFLLSSMSLLLLLLLLVVCCCGSRSGCMTPRMNGVASAFARAFKCTLRVSPPDNRERPLG